jgi:hypothetical protein
MDYRNEDLIELLASDDRVSTYNLRRILYEMFHGRLAPKKIEGIPIKKIDLLNPVMIDLNRKLNRARHRALELAKASHWFKLDEWPDERLESKRKELGSFKAWVLLIEDLLPPKEDEPIIAWNSGSDEAIC